MYKKEITAKVAALFPLYPTVDFDYAHSNDFNPWTIGFQSNYSPSLKRKLVAAIISEMLGCSLQTALKKIPEGIDYGAQEARIDWEINGFLAGELNKLGKNIEAPGQDGTLGALASGLALCRVPLSFQCLITNANRGYLYESMAVARHILELLGWAYAVRPLLTIEAAEAINPQKTIGKLNKFYPKAGKLYGYLSEHSHFMPHRHEQHVHILDSKVATISQSVLYKGYALALAIVLLDVVCALRDEYYCDNMDDSNYLASHEPPILKQGRPTQELLFKIRALWPSEDEAFSEICDLIA